MAKTLTTMAALVATTAALAQPLPQPKTGQCSERVYAERIVLRSEGCALAPGYSQASRRLLPLRLAP
jgi:hypothetical protein